MAKLRVRFSINKGRHGAPLSKLGKIAEQAERFLRLLAADCDIQSKAGDWLAANFKNGSVEYDAELPEDINAGAVAVFCKNIEALADYDPDHESLNLSVSDSTALEYAKIGSLIDPDEAVGIGIYPKVGKIRWRQITYSATSAIRRKIEAPLPVYGSAQRILHAWFKEAREPSFQLREIATDYLIRVHYPASLYHDVAGVVRERTTVMIVSGEMLYDRASRAPIEMKAERLQSIRMLSTAEFEQFFGSAPDFVTEDEYETHVDG